MEILIADQAITFLGGMDLLWLICALAGGAFAALLGANLAFGLVGVSIIFGYAVLATTGHAVAYWTTSPLAQSLVPTLLLLPPLLTRAKKACLVGIAKI